MPDGLDPATRRWLHLFLNDLFSQVGNLLKHILY
jgi:hypothetical protein